MHGVEDLAYVVQVAGSLISARLLMFCMCAAKGFVALQALQIFVRCKAGCFSCIELCTKSPCKATQLVALRSHLVVHSCTRQCQRAGPCTTKICS